MLTARALLAGLSIARLLSGADTEARRFAPSYASSTVVHAASQQSGTFAPNTIVTLYGRQLAYVTRAIGSDDVRDGVMPTVLSGTGVKVLVDNVPVPLYFVSPGQVNLLLPTGLKEGVRKLHLSLDGIAGPVVEFRVAASAPGLFLQQPGQALAVRLDGTLASQENPARPGDTLILFATGLGPVEGAPPRAGEVAKAAAALLAMDGFTVKLNDRPVPRNHIYYAGLAPGFAGLYQINLRIPDDAPADPEIRLVTTDAESPPAVRLPLRPRF